MMSDDPIILAAQRWYGYGEWSAPYWFVGPEPGMKKVECNNLRERCDAWLGLCKGRPQALVDSYAHHEAFHRLEYFTPTIKMKRPVLGLTLRPPLQDTWRQLIRMLLAFEGERTDNDMVGYYQSVKWGRKDAETCVLELSALAKRSLATIDPSGINPRDLFCERATYIRQMVGEGTRFVVLYGRGQRVLPYWHFIATGHADSGSFEVRRIGHWDAGFVNQGATAFALTAHPVNPGGKAPPDQYWIEVGQILKSRVPSQSSDA
jgi:hypothetical protein